MALAHIAARAHALRGELVGVWLTWWALVFATARVSAPMALSRIALRAHTLRHSLVVACGVRGRAVRLAHSAYGAGSHCRQGSRGELVGAGVRGQNFGLATHCASLVTACGVVSRFPWDTVRAFGPWVWCCPGSRQVKAVGVA